jgi:two-component system alkaline phosphatase synthesis response regulator PhoP
MLNILIVEDENNLGETLSEYLQSLGHQALWARDGKSARAGFKNANPNLVLMDIGLPDTSGLDLAREFRKERKDFVLLFLSAQNDPETRVQGLEIGADDYITKPFALKELTLRLNRILKSQIEIQKFPEEINHGPLKIWFKRFEVQDADGNIIALSQKECAILELLYQKKNQAVDREEIIEKIWGEDKFPSNRTVDNYIVKLRKWCETDKNKNLDIQSIRSIGYKLVVHS